MPLSGPGCCCIDVMASCFPGSSSASYKTPSPSLILSSSFSSLLSLKQKAFKPSAFEPEALKDRFPTNTGSKESYKHKHSFFCFLKFKDPTSTIFSSYQHSLTNTILQTRVFKPEALKDIPILPSYKHKLLTMSYLMAKSLRPVQQGTLTRYQTEDFYNPNYVPYWVHHFRPAQNLLEYSTEPIIYDHDDPDYQDNCFFFPEDCSGTPHRFCEHSDTEIISSATSYFTDGEEDCSWTPHQGGEHSDTETVSSATSYFADDELDEDDDIAIDVDIMSPDLPDIKMLDAEALGDLLEDNLSLPEITSLIVFATNGAIFAQASHLTIRQLRTLSATYGAAHSCYAKNGPDGNLTAVKPASHPSSYITIQSFTLSGVGSIVFELDNNVAVVTRIADKVLLAAVGPSKLASPPQPLKPQVSENNETSNVDSLSNTDTTQLARPTTTTPTDGRKPDSLEVHLERQFQIDRSADLDRLATLQLTTPPTVLLALESKSAALGKFLGQKLASLESPEDF